MGPEIITSNNNNDISSSSTKLYIDEICSQTSLYTPSGKQICTEKCQHSKCCFSTNPTTNCKSYEKQFCYDYSSCSTIFTTTSPTTNSLLEDICSYDNFDKESCELKCNIAKCCFVNNMDTDYCGYSDYE